MGPEPSGCLVGRSCAHIQGILHISCWQVLEQGVERLEVATILRRYGPSIRCYMACKLVTLGPSEQGPVWSPGGVLPLAE